MSRWPTPEKSTQTADDEGDAVDLIKEREELLRSFLKRGTEFTEELIQENRTLRREIAELREHNARLTAQVASDDAIRELLRTVESLEKERGLLTTKSRELEHSRREHEDRYVAIERELGDLANLYVASHQLHGSLSVRRVIRQLCDMLGQLVGAKDFIIYVMDTNGADLIPIGHQGVTESDLKPVPVGEGPVGQACTTGKTRVQQLLRSPPKEQPLAVVPLMADGRAVGVIAILSLLDQKRGWASIDEELFKLIGTRAGPALIAANLYAKASGPVSALAGLRDQL